jgi:hypothetical protein
MEMDAKIYVWIKILVLRSRNCGRCPYIPVLPRFSKVVMELIPHILFANRIPTCSTARDSHIALTKGCFRNVPDN